MHIIPFLNNILIYDIIQNFHQYDMYIKYVFSNRVFSCFVSIYKRPYIFASNFIGDV